MVKDTLKRIGLMLTGAAIATAMMWHIQNPPPKCTIFIIKDNAKQGNFPHIQDV